MLHNWDDGRALTILRRCREAMHAKSRVLLFEMLLREENSNGAMIARLTDLQMLVIHRGGERTLAEIDSLLRRAGLHVTEVRPTGTPLTLIEAGAHVGV